MRLNKKILRSFALGVCFGIGLYFLKAEDKLPDGSELDKIGDLESCNDRNNPKGCYNLGVFYYNLQNFELAKPQFERGCIGKLPRSCFQLSRVYQREGNLKEAYYWAKRGELLKDSQSMDLAIEVATDLDEAARKDVHRRIELIK